MNLILTVWLPMKGFHRDDADRLASIKRGKSYRIPCLDTFFDKISQELSLGHILISSLLNLLEPGTHI